MIVNGMKGKKRNKQERVNKSNDTMNEKEEK